MRFILLIIFCSISLSVSAQWYKYNPFKKHERYAQIALLKDHSMKRLPVAGLAKVKITNARIERTPYSLLLMEASVIKTAQHNMRFRVYNTASYNFSDLAQMYLKQNRLSEAKWYLLQSLLISRQQNDNRHTITNLINLAAVKTGYGDYAQAKQDLVEARTLASSLGLTMDVAAVDKQMHYLQDNKNTLKTEIRYAETADADPKTAIK
nr:hypothetical protein [Mucilaginibacter sp. SP1R1]MBB6150214.1 hypothetical protein [Mucilaginibacter sp. SP1R1]